MLLLWYPFGPGVAYLSSYIEDMDEAEVSESEEALVMVPERDIVRPPIEMKAFARSNTLPLKACANDALCGVAGTVAWTAGPRAALCGVIGICMVAMLVPDRLLTGEYMFGWSA